MAVNTLAVVAQLRETQEKLRASEARCKALEQEVARLKEAAGDLGGGASTPTTDATTVVGREEALRRKVAALEAGQRELAGDATTGLQFAETEATDALLRELRRGTVELTRRNTVLEREAVERSGAVRRQYELHIDALELELRRAKTGTSAPPMQRVGSGTPFGSPPVSAPPEAFGSNGAPATSLVFQSPVPRSIPRSSAGRTTDSRRSLI